MTLAQGLHFLEDSYSGETLPSAVFLDRNEWGHTRGEIVGLRSEKRLVRPYFKGNPSADDFAAKARAWGARGCAVQVLNEPNHPIEEWRGGPEAYRRFFAQVRHLAPGVKLYWAGMSPGFPDWQAWYEGADAADGIAAHAYGSGAELAAPIAYLRQRFPSTPIWVAETNFGPGPGRIVDRNAWALAELHPFLAWCDSLGVEAVSYFAWKWPHPDMDMGTPVDAAGTQIGKVLAEWKPSAPPAPTPPAPRWNRADVATATYYSEEVARALRGDVDARQRLVAALYAEPLRPGVHNAIVDLVLPILYKVRDG